MLYDDIVLAKERSDCGNLSVLVSFKQIAALIVMEGVYAEKAEAVAEWNLLLPVLGV